MQLSAISDTRIKSTTTNSPTFSFFQPFLLFVPQFFHFSPIQVVARESSLVRTATASRCTSCAISLMTAETSATKGDWNATENCAKTTKSSVQRATASLSAGSATPQTIALITLKPRFLVIPSKNLKKNTVEKFFCDFQASIRSLLSVRTLLAFRSNTFVMVWTTAATTATNRTSCAHRNLSFVTPKLKCSAATAPAFLGNPFAVTKSNVLWFRLSARAAHSARSSPVAMADVSPTGWSVTVPMTAGTTATRNTPSAKEVN